MLSRIFAPLLASCVAALIAFAGGQGTPSFAQTAAQIPANAHSKSFGGGWNCDLGYRRANGGCKGIVVPENAYPTSKSYGRGWECKHGHTESAEGCTPIQVPKNAYLTPTGARWACDRGFRRVEETCLRVQVPENGSRICRDFGPPDQALGARRRGARHCGLVGAAPGGTLVRSHTLPARASCLRTRRRNGRERSDRLAGDPDDARA